MPAVGVLALQGAFAAHRVRLSDLGVRATEVRTPADLDGVDALVIPGGESSTLSSLLITSGLVEPLKARLAEGMAVFGTCAGLILLAARIADGRPDQLALGALDVTVRRNAYGRQRDSFEATVTTAWGEVPGTFIRAPRIEEIGPDVEVLGTHEGEAVLIRERSVMACTFHPELSPDTTIHERFLALIGEHTTRRRS